MRITGIIFERAKHLPTNFAWEEWPILNRNSAPPAARSWQRLQ